MKILLTATACCKRVTDRQTVEKIINQPNQIIPLIVWESETGKVGVRVRAFPANGQNASQSLLYRCLTRPYSPEDRTLFLQKNPAQSRLDLSIGDTYSTVTQQQNNCNLQNENESSKRSFGALTASSSLNTFIAGIFSPVPASLQ